MVYGMTTSTKWEKLAVTASDCWADDLVWPGGAPDLTACVRGIDDDTAFVEWAFQTLLDRSARSQESVQYCRDLGQRLLTRIDLIDLLAGLKEAQSAGLAVRNRQLIAEQMSEPLVFNWEDEDQVVAGIGVVVDSGTYGVLQTRLLQLLRIIPPDWTLASDLPLSADQCAHYVVDAVVRSKNLLPSARIARVISAVADLSPEARRLALSAVVLPALSPSDVALAQAAHAAVPALHTGDEGLVRMALDFELDANPGLTFNQAWSSALAQGTFSARVTGRLRRRFRARRLWEQIQVSAAAWMALERHD